MLRNTSRVGLFLSTVAATIAIGVGIASAGGTYGDKDWCDAQDKWHAQQCYDAYAYRSPSQAKCLENATWWLSECYKGTCPIWVSPYDGQPY
ncbi:hypothetical protein NS07_v2contig00015-0082 [Nocardia seriolae]|nr:hypothetical protein NS07_v2contig00015-0082 [Nocardia seriolae]GEM23051.1 hypothetical protein NS2_12900 [Nocardia seriolae NBRC 15557]